jgi:phosphoglycerol transferase MdoB-like AlkP superfamily enzyme
MLAGGHRTSEGMFSTFCSYPNPLGSTIAETPLQEFEYACLPRFLHDRGYATEFLQGTRVNTSGIGAFSISLGFAQSFGREAIAIRHFPENGWGVQDPDLYDFALDRMRAASTPFFMAINTNSTHDVVLPKGVGPWFNDGSRVSAHLDAMHYADQALAAFLAACAKESWARSTVFVLVADHGHGSNGSLMDGFVIPFAIYAPGLVAPQLVPRIATQRDIAPTVLEILGLSRHAWPMAGKSLLHNDEAPYFADYYQDGILGWISDNRLVEIPVVNPSQYKNFAIGENRRLVARRQDSLGARHVRDALAFTQFTQQLLTTGRTGQLPVSTP